MFDTVQLEVGGSRAVATRRKRAGKPAKQSARQAKAINRRFEPSKFQSYIFSPAAQLVPYLLGLTLTAAIAHGWYVRDEDYFTPETGLGYWLGVSGAFMMLLLLAYPLRKRIRAMRTMGSVGSWFRVHMLLGVIGPVLILFHANFKLGSLNSSVALLSMLTVAISGLVGRYLYSKVHMGLYGQKAELHAILSDAGELRALFGPDLERAPAIIDLLERYERRVLHQRSNFISDVAAAIMLGVHSRRCRNQLLSRARKLIHQRGRARGKTWWQRRRRFKRVRRHVDLYFAAISKAARLALFERLFAAWHLLHLPLFLVLVCAAVVHVTAVHLY